MTKQSVGGFIGNPEEAFSPAATGDCCGAPAAAASTTADAGDVETTGCCRSPTAAVEAAEAGCCGQAAANTQATNNSSIGCCG